MISMFFPRCHPLAGGSLAIGYANIMGYTVLSGLAAGMDPICTQSHGAGRSHLLVLDLRWSVLLLSAFIPISLWFSMRGILLLCGQDPENVAAAHSFILFSLPDLLLSLLQPLRSYLCSQSITLPLIAAAAAAASIHFPSITSSSLASTSAFPTSRLRLFSPISTLSSSSCPTSTSLGCSTFALQQSAKTKPCPSSPFLSPAAPPYASNSGGIIKS